MTGRGSKKRYSSQPLGGEAKDARGEEEANVQTVQAGDNPTWSEVTAKAGGRGGGFQTSNRFGLLAQASSYPDRSMRSASISSRGSRRGTTVAQSRADLGAGSGGGQWDGGPNQDLEYSESSLGPNSKFVTPIPEGAYRDDFAIEFQQINGKPFRGSITVKEARNDVFKEILGFNPALLHSIRPVFGGIPTIRFKLKEQINLDDLTGVEYFDLERRVNPSRTDIISCRIMGIRGMQAAPNYDGTSNDVRWVKIENCEYALEEEEIMEWLRLYGQPLSLLGEDVFPDSDSDSAPLGNGTYSLKMKLVKDIPQYLPMHGRKIRVYFKNMTKLCTNCYGCHTRRQCTNDRVPWVVYVRDFMKANPDITENFYGKWWDVIDQEFPGYFDEDKEDVQDESTPAQPPLRNEAPALPTSSRPTRFAPARTTDQNSQQRQSRDPRVRRQQEEEVELDSLVVKGLTIDEAKNYLKNKKEQKQLEQRMKNLSTNLSSQVYNRGKERETITKTGPGSTRGGRGGLSFN
jgi:hypothetical protein